MQRESSNNIQPPDDEGTTIALSVPVPDTTLFKHGATGPVLQFLADNPDLDFSVSELAVLTPHTERATRDAIAVLEANDLVISEQRTNVTRIHINRARLENPDDPFRSIPQPEYQTPVRIACASVRAELATVHGIILFGSVARGEADRQSDIDLWVLVDDDAMAQRHAANQLARTLGDLRIPSTVSYASIRDLDLEAGLDRIRSALETDGDGGRSAERYSFEIIVESPTSIINQASRVDPERLFGMGITLHGSELLDRVKREVLASD